MVFKTTVTKSAFVIVALATATIAWSAEPRFGTIAGTVTDVSGEPLNRAVVQLKNLASLQIRSYITDRRGRYHFNRIYSEVDYEIKARYRGKWSKVAYLSRYDFKVKMTKNLQIKRL